jgi:hypothetical protein
MRLEAAVRVLLEEAWREPGFCVPNQTVYPHQWLWDSCFHALVWGALGEPRGVVEVASALSGQDSDGFVPHMIYWHEPEAAVDLWGRSRASTITQPPMYGHALAVLALQGFDVPDEVMAGAARALLALADRPATPAGLVPVFHPWETGCDDSARWDDWLPDGLDRADDNRRREVWRQQKAEMVAGLERTVNGAASAGPDFTVGSVGFNALVAWNALELASAAADGGDLIGGDLVDRLNEVGGSLADAVAARWRDDRWIDDGPESGRTRTLDAMVPLLVDPRPEAFDQLVDPRAFGAPFGPRGAHRDEPSYRPDIYWRGPAWPQLGYLVWEAARRADHSAAETLADQLIAGAEASGFAEYWNPETGEGLGARPQTWAGLALLALQGR